MTRLWLCLAGLAALLLAVGGCTAPALPQLPPPPQTPDLSAIPTLVARIPALPTLAARLPALPTLAPTRTPAPPLPTATRISVATATRPSTRTPPPTAMPAPAASPAPTISPTPIQPTVTPGAPVLTPTAPPWPTPPALEEYPAAVAALLTTSGGDVEALRDTLAGWEALPAGLGDVSAADLDGDGQDEVIVPLAERQPSEALQRRGLVLVLRRSAEGYTVAWQGERPLTGAQPGPGTLFTVEDLSGDGHPELAYTSHTCGAHTCFTTVNIFTWSEGDLVPLTEGEITMPSADWVQFVDQDGDGTQELVLHGGSFGSVGAGPPRTRTEVYRWDGVAYTLAEIRPDPSRYLYWTVIDANQALLRGEVEEAIRLYRQAREDPYLETWLDEAERAKLGAFASYRLVVAHALLGEDTQVRFWADRLEQEQPENPYTIAARRFWEVYRLTGDVGAACQVVTSFVEANPEMVEVLAGYGYATPPFSVEDVCPFPVSTPLP